MYGPRKTVCCLVATIVPALLLLWPALTTAQIVNQDNPFCKAVFDFYFVLDR